MLGVGDVCAVVIKRRQCANQPGHDGHRMRIAPEAAQKKLHLLVNHRVIGHQAGEVLFLRCVGQLAVQQQMAGL